MTEEKVFSAKQVATRIGTDAKTLRKFFRSPASNFEAVGQGGRYEFPAKDIDAIKAAFTAWSKGKTPSKPTPKAKGTASTPKVARGKRTRQPKVDREPGEHRGLPMIAPSIARKKMQEELAARGKARDEEYGTVDGEEVTDEELEDLELSDDELTELVDSVNDMVFEDLELDEEDDDENED